MATVCNLHASSDSVWWDKSEIRLERSKDAKVRGFLRGKKLVLSFFSVRRKGRFVRIRLSSLCDVIVGARARINFQLSCAPAFDRLFPNTQLSIQKFLEISGPKLTCFFLIKLIFYLQWRVKKTFGCWGLIYMLPCTFANFLNQNW